MGDQTVHTKDSVIYLGVILDTNIAMSKHISYIRKKTKKVCRVLKTLMPKIGGPKSNRRKLLVYNIGTNFNK